MQGDIEKLQNTVGYDIVRFTKYLTDTIRDIREAKNPEKIKESEEKISAIALRIHKLTEEVSREEKSYKDLKIYLNLRKYLTDREMYKTTTKNIKQLD